MTTTLTESDLRCVQVAEFEDFDHERDNVEIYKEIIVVVGHDWRMFSSFEWGLVGETFFPSEGGRLWSMNRDVEVRDVEKQAARLRALRS